MWLYKLKGLDKAAAKTTHLWFLTVGGFEIAKMCIIVERHNTSPTLTLCPFESRRFSPEKQNTQNYQNHSKTISKNLKYVECMEALNISEPFWLDVECVVFLFQ